MTEVILWQCIHGSDEEEHGMSNFLFFCNGTEQPLNNNLSRLLFLFLRNCFPDALGVQIIPAIGGMIFIKLKMGEVIGKSTWLGNHRSSSGWQLYADADFWT